MPLISGGTLMPLSGRAFYSYAAGSPALGTTTAVHAAAATSTAVTTVSAAITNPDVPRNVTATVAAGTLADILAVQVVVTGTDSEDRIITESLPVFTASTAGTVTGSKAFKTVTQYVIPAMGGATPTVALGLGAKLGIPRRLTHNTVLRAVFNGVVEATAPTVVADATNLSGNMATLNSALNGSAVIIDYFGG